MPELPEVEALRRGLVTRIVGSKILKVEVRQEKLVAGKGTTRKPNEKKTKEFIEGLEGKTIKGIERRAKNLVFDLGNKSIMLVHLKMTGQLVFVANKIQRKTLEISSQKQRASLRSRGNLLSFSEESKDFILGGHPIQESENKLPHKHTYIIFTLNNGTLYYNDVRQFGYVLYYPDKSKLEEENHFENIGLEPFDTSFTLKYFKEAIKGKTTPIKKLLLDQTIVVGCGNIYCDEVCWASSVLPMRPARSLKENEVKKVYENIKKILKKAVESGGSSVANYLLADGKRGNYTDYHNVYHKEGTKCKFPKCKGIIQKITFVGRGTHFCPVHQK